MSRAIEIAKSSLSLLTSQLMITLISIAYVAYFARVFSFNEMALFASIAIFSGWSQWLGSLGLGTLGIKDAAQLIAEGKIGQVKILLTSITYYRTLGILTMSMLMFLLAPLIVTTMYGNLKYLSLTRFLIVISFFISLRAVFVEIQNATQRFHQRSAISVIAFLTEKTGSVIGFFASGVTGFYVGYFLATIIGTMLTYWDIRKFIVTKLTSFRSLFAKSKEYMILDLLRGFLDQTDRPVIGFFLGAEQLALYHIAKQLFANAQIMLNTIIVPVGVKFGEVKAFGQKQLKQYFCSSISMTLFFFIPFGSFLVAISKPLICLYAGQNYVLASTIAMMFGFTIMAQSFWSIYREAALRLIAARYLLLQYIISALLTGIGYTIFLPKLNAFGIPLAMAIGYFGGGVPTIYWIKQKCGLAVSWADVYPSFVAAGIVFPTVLVSFVIVSAWLQITTIIFFASLLYLFALSLCGPSAAQEIINKTGLRCFLKTKSIYEEKN